MKRDLQATNKKHHQKNNPGVCSRCCTGSGSGEESVDKAEVAPGDAGDRGDSLDIGVIVEVKGLPESAPAPLKAKAQLFLGQRSVFVGEADPAVQLR